MAPPLAVRSGRTERLRQWTGVLVEPGARGGEAYDLFMVWLICLNLFALVLETVRPVQARYQALFAAVEAASVLLFTLDYLLRLWTCTLRPEFVAPVRGRFRYALTPLAVLDLLAVVPFYLPLLGVDLRVLRAARLLRVLSLGKLVRYSGALQMVARVVARRREELMTTLVLAGLLLLGASTLMYLAERHAQPEEFSSIPAAMWWGIATLTTVGFGDVYPVTSLGKVLSSVIAVVGIGIVALPTGILSAGFIEELDRRRHPAKTACPHCGGALSPSDAPHPHSLSPGERA